MRTIGHAFRIAALIIASAVSAVASETDGAPLDEVARAPAEAVTASQSASDPDAIAPPRPHDPADPADGSITLVFGGDLGLGGSNQPVLSSGALRHGKRLGWSELTAGIAPLVNGDINFANLETVVTDRNDLSANPKAFNFKSHPAGMRHLVGLGFNVFSLANNHALDYGEAGVRETLRHLDGLAALGLRGWPGIGHGREQASRPADVTVKGARVRISAIGIGGNGLPAREPAGERQRAGMLSYNRAEDFLETIDRLADAEGDLRILSVHYGSELQIRAGSSDVEKLRDVAARGASIDIVVGHHAHVAAGVQLVDGKLVLYGLGNLLHSGMQDMARFGVCRDYGLLVRVHAARAGGRLVPRAIEAVPLTEMHSSAKPLEGDAGRQRIEVLNHLAGDLDASHVGASGIRFRPRPDGSGLHCLPGAEREPGRIGSLCSGWEPPLPPSSGLMRRIAGSCGGSLMARRGDAAGAARKGATERARVSRHQSDAGKSGSMLTSILGW